MNKLSAFSAVVTASLACIVTECTWSGDATANESEAPALHAPVPPTVPVPSWYPPAPNRGGYAQPWQQPPHWAMPPRSYSQLPPPYPMRRLLPAVPSRSAVAENPLSAELKQTQQQLTENRTQLEQAHATIEQLREELQHSLKVEQAHKNNVAAITSEHQSLQAQVTELTGELNTTTAILEQNRQQTTNDRQQTRMLTVERDRLRNELVDRNRQLTTLQSELQTATQTVQQANSERATSDQQLGETRARTETLNNEVAELNVRLESLESRLANTKKTLADVIAERDQLQADLASKDLELSQAQIALAAAPPEADETSQLDSQTVEAIVPATTGEVSAADAVELAALQIASSDTDQDGVADNIDLCIETAQGIAVESTGCAADVAINLKGVNFRYNSHELTDEAQLILDRVADTLSLHADLRLEVAGHTDSRGDPAYNQWLSLQRAQTVRDYLVTKGVNPSHIGAAGYGGEQPIADNTTKEGLYMNRRVELRSVQ